MSYFYEINLFVIILLFVALVIILKSVRILREYERAVIFTLGRFTGVRGPGIILVIPFIQQIVKTDLRVITMDVPSQDVISRDNISVKVSAVLYFKVVAPEKAVIQVEQVFSATSELAQTTLRAVLGRHELDEMLSERDKLNVDIQQILDEQTASWGVKVTNVEIKHIDIAENMVRAIARQAEAERERRAKVILAEGELQAAEALREAAHILDTQPAAMQLRYLQTLTQVASDRSSTIVFPVPVDLMSSIMKNSLSSLVKNEQTDDDPSRSRPEST
ncbi:slipin family protein [Alcaligenes endophyticus]|uniref:Slipin family protein n=1 Tax=Alcaligenes endophyticus TaxID=1929088 RepID=A0ABT8EJK1_9BURK|nr:slipin family protein [Alcaligenes endophyticus]MCX5591791.1 slipin family protein [Alcaligenes endophyticus]MDN4121468.1 slipin family protein [Alcaligenes endophyticus]